METSKKTVLITALIAFLGLVAAGLFQKERLPNPIVINTSGQPSIGTGDTEIIVFEDLSCIHCRIFSDQVIPKISSAYVETGKARLTFILVAFGDDSKPLANAALGVYKNNPDRFIPFAHDLLHSSAREKEGILNVAVNVGGIDLNQLTVCIDQKLYYQEIDQNLIWAKRLMGEDFGTPTLLVDGRITSTDSFQDVQDRIQQIEKEKVL